MNKRFPFALSLSVSLFMLSAGVFPVVFAYQIEYNSHWQISSGSMNPTLEVLDWVYVKNVSGQAEVYASYGDGDIILFRKPGDPNQFIIHRAVEKFQSDTIWYFKAKADNNVAVDPWDIPEDHVVGKVLAFSRIHQVNSQDVTIFSNSVFGDFHLNSSINALELDIGSYLTQSAPNSFLNITIPNELVTGELDVLANRLPIPFEHSTNATHHFIWFDWEGTNYTADIILPELPRFLILPFFMIATLLATILYRRKHSM